MYREDPRFDTPRDKEAKIWRYMSIDKYADMLRRRSLYFCAGARLQSEDPYEGSYLSFDLLKTAEPPIATDFARKMKSCGPPIAVNCWHLSPFESLAMWRLYANEIAVQSTVGRLLNALAECPCEVYVGKVHYIMLGEEAFTSKSMDVFTPWLHKHCAFEYEQELRAIIWDTPVAFPRESDGSVRTPIDVEALVDCVYVAPRAEVDVKNDVEKMNHQYGFSIPVHQSRLAKPPLY